MDRFAQLLGFLMVALTLYVAVASRPPIGEAVLRAVAPTRVDVFAIITIVGGAVGGYITRRIVGTYRHPLWLTIAGGIVAASMAAMGVWSLATQIPLLFR